MPLQELSAPYAHSVFTAENGDLIRVVPERGGLLTGWQVQGREIIYLDLERFLTPGQSVRGGAPILFPICGNLPGDSLPLTGGRTATLKQHGFARNLPWSLSALSDGRGVRLELSDSEQTRSEFPFEFLLQLDYCLAPGVLEVAMKLHNRSDQPLPFSFGLHPYFSVSGLTGLSFEGMPEQGFDHKPMAAASTASVLTQLDQGIDLLVRPAGNVALVDAAAGQKLTMELSDPWNLAVFWTDPPRSMVCMEPWTGPRQSLISGDRKLELAPGEQRSLCTRYVVSAA